MSRRKVRSIGTSVAPVLSDSYVANVDREIKNRLEKDVVRVFTYVDDSLESTFDQK